MFALLYRLVFPTYITYINLLLTNSYIAEYSKLSNDGRYLLYILYFIARPNLYAKTLTLRGSSEDN